MQTTSSSSSSPSPLNLVRPTTSPDACLVPPLFIRRQSKSQERLSTYEPRSDGAEHSSYLSLTQKPTNDPRSPKRLSICGFLPLPSITASPICTPTPSSSSQNPSELFESATGESTPVTNPASCESSRVLYPPLTPTWIATPPTPPSKSLRRSNTTAVSSRRPQFTLFSPSASFPASMHPHAILDTNTGLKRSSSVPALHSRSQHAAEVLFSFMDAQIVLSPKAIPDSFNEYPFDASFPASPGTIGPIKSRRRKERAGSHALPIFHLPGTVPTTDNEEDGEFLCDSHNNRTREDPSPVGSWSDHSIEDIWETERNKDALRKFHALKELLSTEVGYLTDLKALVTVYLRNLPTLVARSLATSTTFGRASASFTSGPWIQSYTQLQAAATSSSMTLPESQNLAASTSSSTKEPAKPNTRYIFSDHELETLTRNAEEILQLHEQFVRELRDILQPLGFVMEHDENDHGYQHLPMLDAALRAVSTKFATEASRFNAYQTFCAGHPEAMDVLRKAYQRFPLELDAFEQRCSTMVAEMLDDVTRPSLTEPRPHSARSSSDSPPSVSHHTLTVDDRKRTMSLTSLDGAVKSLRPRPSMTMSKDSVAFPTESKRDKNARRIALMDYMIKPIQRICKYPLLLDQLLPSKALRTLSQNGHRPDSRSGIDVVVESAAQAMRHVASSVDEARHRQDIAIQSGLIFSRMCLGLQSMASSSSPSAQTVTTEFLSSLGDCLLSGSLDVMHHHPSQPLGQTSSIKAKYFGAFLYTGGYLILVKVSKGKKYEPKHWFALTEFEVSDVQDDAILPCSFRLSCGEQHYELAAACQREKDAWLTSIHDSLTHVVNWINEPTPSFKFGGKGELLPASDDGHSESPNGLSTIRSIPELGSVSDTECSEPFFASLRGHRSKSKKKRRGYESPLNLRQDFPPPPSRRSSSNSVKNIFSPMSSDSETVLIRRSSPVARHQVDQELQDVISQSCLTARSYAFSHEMELFQAPKATKTAFSRSNSGMGMRLSKHESIRIPRRRTTESLDSVLSRGASPLNTSTISSRRNAKKLSIASISLKDFDGSAAYATSPGSAAPSPYPSPPASQASSRAVAARRSLETESSTTPTYMYSSDRSPAKPRSFVRNVKGLFQFRPVSPASPVSVIVSQPSQNSIQSPTSISDQSSNTYNMLHRWTIRRRARSVSEEPDVEMIFDDPEKSFPIPTLTTTSLST